MSKRVDTQSSGIAIDIVLSLLLALPALYIVLSAIHTILAYSVSIVVQDQLVVYPSLIADPFWEAIIQTRNGHRMVPSALVSMVDIFFFKTSNYFLVATVLVSLSTFAGALLVSVTASRKLGVWTKGLLALATMALLFWFGCSRLLGVPFSGVNVYTTELFFGLTIICFHLALRREAGYKRVGLFILALSGGIVTSNSFGTGMAIWPVLVVLGFRYRCTVLEGVAILSGALATSAMYFLLPGSHVVRAKVGIDPVQTGAFFLKFVGSVPHFMIQAIPQFPAEYIAGTAMGIGFLALLISVILIFNSLRLREPPDPLVSMGLALLVFGLGTAALISLGRSTNSSEFIEVRLAPRYLNWSILYWMGLLYLLAPFAEQFLEVAGRRGRWVLVPLVLFLWLLIPSHNVGITHTYVHNESVRRQSLTFQVGHVTEHDLFSTAGRGELQGGRVQGTLELYRYLKLGEMSFFRDHKYKLVGQDAVTYFDIQRARHCKGAFGILSIVRDPGLVEGTLTPVVPVENGIVGLWVRGDLPPSEDRPDFYIFVDEAGKIEGLGHEERRYPNVFWSSRRRAHGYIRNVREGSLITPYAVQDLFSPRICRMRVLDTTGAL